LITAAIGFLLGVRWRTWLARNSFPLKGVVEGLIDLPIVCRIPLPDRAAFCLRTEFSPG